MRVIVTVKWYYTHDKVVEAEEVGPERMNGFLGLPVRME